MDYFCDDCERGFRTYNGYSQHMNDAAVHQQQNQYQYYSSSSSEAETLAFECEYCDKQFATYQARHQHSYSAYGHPYCRSCERMFQNQNSLDQHLRSRTHTGSTAIECPWCHEGFATASGVTIHLESGRCTVSGFNRQKINAAIAKLDRHHVITKPQITMPGYEGDMIATERAWNGWAYKCYLCPREFRSLAALNQHIGSPAHEQKLYRCPGRGCGREYKVLSGLVQHVESESCGLMRFADVQRNAKDGLQNMVGRMIRA